MFCPKTGELTSRDAVAWNLVVQDVSIPLLERKMMIKDNDRMNFNLRELLIDYLSYQKEVDRILDHRIR
jgi:hypothetical protein